MANNLIDVSRGEGAPTPKILEDYISNGMALIHSPEMQGTIIEQLQEEEDDAKALADLTFQVVKRLDQSASSNKVDGLTHDVRMQGASVFLTQLVEVGEASGTIDVKEEDVKKAAGMAVGRYMKEGLADGTVTEDDMRAAYKDIQKESGGKTPTFDKDWAPGVNKASVKIPKTSPQPSILGGQS